MCYARSRRRTLLRGLGLASVGLALGGACMASPSSQPRLRRIGFLNSNIGAQDEVFRRRLAELGYGEGTDLTIEWRFGNNDLDQLPRLAPS